MAQFQKQNFETSNISVAHWQADLAMRWLHIHKSTVSLLQIPNTCHVRCLIAGNCSLRKNGNSEVGSIVINAY
jgi:hypothetical protein